MEVDPQLLDKAWEKLSGGSTASTIEASPEVFVEWSASSPHRGMISSRKRHGSAGRVDSSFAPNFQKLQKIKQVVPTRHESCAGNLQ